MTHQIECMYAWVVVGDDGDDGIPAIKMPDGMMLPLVASDRTRLDILTGIAKSNHASDHKEWKLIKFSNPEIMVVLPANETH